MTTGHKYMKQIFCYWTLFYSCGYTYFDRQLIFKELSYEVKFIFEVIFLF